jgi:hypothetical protein
MPTVSRPTAKERDELNRIIAYTSQALADAVLDAADARKTERLAHDAYEALEASCREQLNNLREENERLRADLEAHRASLAGESFLWRTRSMRLWRHLNAMRAMKDLAQIRERIVMALLENLYGDET